MNFVDICVLAVIGLSALLALSRGLVKEVLSILSWVGAVLAVIFLLPRLRPIAIRYISEPLLADIVTGIGIFVIAIIVLGIINHYLSANVRSSALGALDRSLGLVFGLIRGAVIVSFAYILMTWALPNAASRPDVVREARTEPLVAQGADFLKSLLPADVINRGSMALDTGMQKIEQGKALNDAYNGLTGNTAGNAAGVKPPPGSGGTATVPAGGAAGADQTSAKPGGQASGSGYKDAERKDLERLLQGAQ
ncbi:CvpA family protein [Dongia soli]|uniref:CvpA family protein n=1 Tax=Dongia soli TaxID=600628 RepID=A0ABU5ECE7_9PROT|nr:CvpA family protein [Dongia soli]MDY0884041.1 CvpA family protein [Dongia soli]